MSVQIYQQRINTIDREIANLERQVADQMKTEARCQQAIANIERTMRNCSASLLKSKLSQIESQKRSQQWAIDKRVNLSAQIARKREERARQSQYLQRAVEEENRRQQQAQADMMRQYEHRISELTAALSRSVSAQIPTQNLYSGAGTEEHDVFISHATEDKESFVNEFKAELEKRGVDVWIDDIAIKWGDSLRAKIDNGLKSSRFGIVVISRHFIRKGWTNYELDGLFEKEMTCGKTILPIWHDISKKEVQDFSSTLAGRKAMTTGNMTAAEIADELVKLLPIREEVASENAATEDEPVCLPVGGGDGRDDR